MDPITGFAALQAAFAGVKGLVEAGQEIEDVFSALQRWATVASDMQEWCGQQDSKPSIFKKLSFGDDTANAVNAVMVRHKLQQQETEIREMFQWYGPPGMYEEFIKQRRSIKEHRERTIYEQARMRQAFLYNSFYTVSIVVCISALFWLGSIVLDNI